MLTDTQWSHLRHFLSTVINREGDEIAFRGGVVQRQPDNDICVRLSAQALDLEPDPEDRIKVTYGEGWPD